MSRAATAPNRAREYETIYILRPDIDADSAEKIGTRLAEVVGREAGRLTRWRAGAAAASPTTSASSAAASTCT